LALLNFHGLHERQEYPAVGYYSNGNRFADYRNSILSLRLNIVAGSFALSPKRDSPD
jgi:hypothetical protein